MRSANREIENVKIGLVRSNTALDRKLAYLTGYVEAVFARALVFLSYGLAISLVPPFAVGAFLKSFGYIARRNPKTYRDHPLDDGMILPQ